MFGLKNLLAIVGLVVVLFVGTGYYLGWYKIGAEADNQGHQELKIQVNTSRVQEDLTKGEKKMLEILEKGKGQATLAAPQPLEPAPEAPTLPPAPAQGPAAAHLEPPPFPKAPPLPIPPPPPPSRQEADSWTFPPR